MLKKNFNRKILALLLGLMILVGPNTPAYSCAVGSCPGTCGDGIWDPGEDCDDGNTNNGDGCSAICRTEPGCGCAVGVGCSCCGNGKLNLTDNNNQPQKGESQYTP